MPPLFSATKPPSRKRKCQFFYSFTEAELGRRPFPPSDELGQKVWKSGGNGSGGGRVQGGEIAAAEPEFECPSGKVALIGKKGVLVENALRSAPEPTNAFPAATVPNLGTGWVH